MRNKKRIKMSGKVYLVGAGPGKADLITVRGLQILRQADVVIYDYLVDKGILEEVKPGAELICCDKLAGKGRYSNGFRIHQEKIHSLIVKKAKEGKRVIRLKSGDASIFSRISQELGALVKNKINFEIVPGVTAASAASAFTGIPLTDRNYSSNCVFVTGHENSVKKNSSLDWQYLARCGTIVLYMAFENLKKIADELVLAGKSSNTPCAIIQDVSRLSQKIITGTLKDIDVKARKGRLKPPVLIIIGEVVKLEKEFNWLRKSRKVLFTGCSDERYFLKNTYMHLPMIKIEPLSDYRKFDADLKNIERFDWIVFTSRYGVKYFFERLKKIELDSRKLKGIKIAAIGSSTKNALSEFCVIADIVPKKETAAGLLEELKKIDLKDKKIFLPRSDISDKGAAGGLTKMGALVSSSVAYKNVMPENLPDLDFEQFNEIMLCSPAGVRNFIKKYGLVPKKVKISCIGEAAKKEAKKCRLLLKNN